MLGGVRAQPPSNGDQAGPHVLPFPSSSQGWNSPPQDSGGAESGLGPRSANTQASRVLEGSAELGGAGQECGQTARSRPPAKDNCSRASFSQRLRLMLHVEQLRQLVQSEACRPARPRLLGPRKWTVSRQQTARAAPHCTAEARTVEGGTQPRGSGLRAQPPPSRSSSSARCSAWPPGPSVRPHAPGPGQRPGRESFRGTPWTRGHGCSGGGVAQAWPSFSGEGSTPLLSWAPGQWEPCSPLL